MKMVKILTYNEDPAGPPVTEEVGMVIVGDWGYRKVVEEDEHDNYAWMQAGKNRMYAKRPGPFYAVTHVPSGLMASSHLTKINAIKTTKALSAAVNRWDGAGLAGDLFLREVYQIAALYDHDKRR